MSDIELLDKHFGTELYLINTDVGKYIVKILPLYMEIVKNEGELTEYLYNHGLKVATFIKNKEDNYVVKNLEYQFTVQQFIEGESLSVNTPPDWFVSTRIFQKELQLYKETLTRRCCLWQKCF